MRGRKLKPWIVGDEVEHGPGFRSVVHSTLGDHAVLEHRDVAPEINGRFIIVRGDAEEFSYPEEGLGPDHTDVFYVTEAEADVALRRLHAEQEAVTIELRLGQAVRVTFMGGDGELFVCYLDDRLMIDTREWADSTGRRGIVYEETFGLPNDAEEIAVPWDETDEQLIRRMGGA